MRELLTVRDLAAGYGGGRVLDGLSIDVRAGEIVALIGRNGVGKTTLMRALMGLVPASAGAIVLEGVALEHTRPYERARHGFGYVPQGREVFPALTVRENLHVGSQVDRTRAAQSFDRIVGYFPVLRAKLRQKAGTMSGGEQQQLAIARALLCQPKVMLLDEPSEGIQPSIVQLIGDTLAQIAADTGIGVLLVEQDMNMVETIASRCCVMDKGRIVANLDRAQLADEALLRQYLAL
jgi:urea ABC transporter ATP-binding protein UrtE